MPRVTFAQLCQTLPEIEESAGIHVFDLYYQINQETSYPFTQTGIPWRLPSGDFLETFYGWDASANQHGNGLFSIDCSGDFMEILHWRALNYPFLTAEAPDISHNNVDILSLVPNQWALDLSSNSPSCWTSCSYMNILKELLRSRNLCNWAGCNVDGICCSLNAQELAHILNSQDPSGANGYRTAGNRSGDIPIGPEGAYSLPAAGGPVALGDHVVLALLFRNPNVLARDIELRLHFEIVRPAHRSTWPPPAHLP